MFDFSPELNALADAALEKAKSEFLVIDRNTEFNQQKMLEAFIKNGVSEAMFAPSTGYGYGDRGREVIDRVFADAVGAEDAVVRHNFTCGTHTLAVALFGVLRPGDTMLCVTGTPYDTIQPVIGIGEASMKMASMLGHSFSVISTGSHSIANKEMLIHKYGLDTAAASVRAPESDVVSYNSADLFMSAAKAAIEKDAAEVLVLGCAGMAGIDKAISERFNVPVLDGIICAMMMAVGMVKAGYTTSKYRQYRGPEK